MQKLEIRIGLEPTLDQQSIVPGHPDVLDFTFVPSWIIFPAY